MVAVLERDDLAGAGVELGELAARDGFEDEALLPGFDDAAGHAMGMSGTATRPARKPVRPVSPTEQRMFSMRTPGFLVGVAVGALVDAAGAVVVPAGDAGPPAGVELVDAADDDGVVGGVEPGVGQGGDEGAGDGPAVLGDPARVAEVGDGFAGDLGGGEGGEAGE
ncbi:MAG: hypothetical protein R3F65_03080 [bacterium]